MTKGKPILFLPGMWCLSEIWDNWSIAVEKANFLPHTIDFFGMGDCSIDEYITEVTQKCRQIETKTGKLPILIGHSMGGLIAQAIASKLDIPSIVLLGSAAPSGISNFSWPVAKRMLPYLFSIMSDNLFRPSQRDAKELIFNNCPERGLILAPGRVAQQIMLGTVKVNHLDCHCLIIGGEKDRMMPLSIQQKLAKKYGQRCHYIKAPYGHMPMLEDQDESLINIILEWIQL